MESSQFIKEAAIKLGFVGCGVSKAEALTGDAARLHLWTGLGMQGQMEYMLRNTEKRIDPQLLVRNAKTVVSLAVNYYSATEQNPALPQIARYAYGKDYHRVVKNMLHELLGIIQKHYDGVGGRAFVDSAPVMEHAWAARSGLGWIGKNSLLILRNYGSYVFIGELIIDLEIEPDQPIGQRCGRCTKCIDACPTTAIVAPYIVDARRCLSYLTIEHKGNFDATVGLHQRLFGCDICQQACPWNKRAQPTSIAEFSPTQSILEKTAADWMQMSKHEFDELTSGSAMQRCGHGRLLRNVVECFSG